MASWKMHQAVQIKLQGKALSGIKKPNNKPVVCCRMCMCTLCVLNSNVCVSESRREAKKTANGEEKREEEEEGGVSIEGQGGMGWKESGSKRKEVQGRRRRKRLTGPACTHHPHQLESLIFPPHNTSPSVSDVYNFQGKN